LAEFCGRGDLDGEDRHGQAGHAPRPEDPGLPRGPVAYADIANFATGSVTVLISAT
jgi:hypothetical protein